MATAMTPKKAVRVALAGVPEDVGLDGQADALIALLPDNTAIITDVAAFKDALKEAYDATIVSDSGNQSRVVEALSPTLRRQIADLIEVLEG